MICLSPFLRPHRGYDPRLRELVFHTGDVSIARDCGVPRSTSKDWKIGKFQDVITLDVFDRELVDLRAEVLKLRRQAKICRAIMGLLVPLVRTFGLKLSEERLPEGEQQERVPGRSLLELSESGVISKIEGGGSANGVGRGTPLAWVAAFPESAPTHDCWK
jgi:hypothetical protein